MILGVYIPTILTYAYKGYLCFDASKKAYHLLTTTQEEPARRTNTRVAASALTALAQAGDMIIDLATPPEVQLISKVVVGAVDITGSLMEKSMQEEVGWLDGLDVASTTLFRVGDGLHITTKIFPKWKDEEKLAIQVCRSASAIVKTVRTYFSSPLDRFTKIPTAFLQDPVLLRYQCPIAERPIRFIVVIDATKQSPSPVYYERREIMYWLQTTPNELPPRWPSTIPFTRDHIISWVEVQQQIDQRLGLLLEQVRISNAYDRYVLEVQRANTIQDFALIPVLFQEDEVLRQYSCTLSHKPMRFTCVVRGTENNLAPIVYEKTAILRWFNEHPGERPRKWPSAIPLTASQLVDYAPIQTFIDQRLQILFEKTKRQLQGEEEPLSAASQGAVSGVDLSSNAMLSNLEQIPEEFLGDETLQQYLCPLQQRPIRTIVVVRGTERSATPIYYEQKAVRNWMHDHPALLPSRWPRSIPLAQENLLSWKPIQNIINKRIKELLDYSSLL
ncbi:MAG: hypothetical protein FJZ58_03445 [Chlamydiae bacterium]|nr:hypothetical protein [Chlamydiota bacterium]